MKKIIYYCILGIFVCTSCRKGTGIFDTNVVYNNGSYLIVNPSTSPYDSTISQTSFEIEGVDLIEDFKAQNQTTNSSNYKFDKIEYQYVALIHTYNLNKKYLEKIELILYNEDKSDSILLANTSASDILENLKTVNSDLLCFVENYPNYFIELVTSFSNYPQEPIGIIYQTSFGISATYEY